MMSRFGFSPRCGLGFALGGIVLLALALVGLVRAARQQPSSQAHHVTIHELSARRLATKTALPQYPPDSLQHRARGVAVVEITFGVDGRVEEARAMQAPDAACEYAVVRAVRRWEFRPLNGPNKRPAIVTTKLTFYFDIDASGRGTVSDGKVPTGTRDQDSAGRFAGTIDTEGTMKLAADGKLLIVDVRPRELSSAESVSRNGVNALGRNCDESL